MGNGYSFRAVIRVILCWVYTCFWESKRYGLLGKLDRPARFLANVLLPIGVAAQLTVSWATGKTTIGLQMFNITLLVMIAAGHLVSYIQQRTKARPPVGDVYEIRNLLENLWASKQKMQRISNHQALVQATERFIEQALKAACRASCGERIVRATLMFKNKNNELTVSVLSEPVGDHDPEFSIPLTEDAHGDLIPKGNKGLAGFAFGKGHTMYLPNRHFRACWQLDLHADGSIAPKKRGDLWKESRVCRFASVLCTPVIDHSTEREHPIAVLNLESPKWDSFGDADFHLISIVADTLADGLVEAKEVLKGLKK